MGFPVGPEPQPQAAISSGNCKEGLAPELTLGEFRLLRSPPCASAGRKEGLEAEQKQDLKPVIPGASVSTSVRWRKYSHS